MPLRGVLLDIDGTLLISNEAHSSAWHDAFAEFGRDIPVSRIEPLIGMGSDKLMGELTPDISSDSETGKAITQRRQEIFLKRYLPSLHPAPGARDLVSRFSDLGLTCTIATSAKDEELDALLQQAGVADLIDEETTSSDAEESKPAPDIVTAALKKSKLPPEDVLMLGDTPFDIASAAQAGVGAVGVRCGGHDTDMGDALAVYDDPADILAHFDESPFAQRLGAKTKK
jgi:HAD superfamily hydrolase (TIGR01509 family)